MRINILALGLSVAILYTLGVIWAFIMALSGVSMAPYEVVNGFYLGWLSPSIGGLILGGIFAFVDGFVAAAILGWLYNKIAKA